ncbi:hypothetical protein [Streptomyces fulvoviolaceus]|uniref:hypothetical protein n=1 Tax=Streptomyces fulvoviolaceus TaxID=285535 RepID=UPI0004CAE399|nr:hypothetical protein [Streptomyces fulvoviolaceus]
MHALGYAADREAAGTSSAASWPTTSPTGMSRRPKDNWSRSAPHWTYYRSRHPVKAELEQVAAVFERATRSRATADLGSTRILRRSGEPQPTRQR